MPTTDTMNHEEFISAHNYITENTAIIEKTVIDILNHQAVNEPKFPNMSSAELRIKVATTATYLERCVHDKSVIPLWNKLLVQRQSSFAFVLHFENERFILKTKFDMKTKLDNTTEPQHDAKLPVVGSASRQVMYMHSLAFTTCDCGEPLTMAQTIYADPTYKGECKCGKVMKLRNGKLWQSLS